MKKDDTTDEKKADTKKEDVKENKESESTADQPQPSTSKKVICVIYESLYGCGISLTSCL